jgi:hypothetical protein
MTRLFDDPDFEPGVAAWLEEDPNIAPPAVLDTVLAAFPSIPQRRASRVPWRLQTMNRFALMGAAAAIVAAGLGGLALLAGAQGRGTIDASPSPALTQEFASPRNGYAVQYPVGWSATTATSTWLPNTHTLWGDPALDTLQSQSARFVAASQPLADGQTADAWYQAYCTLGRLSSEACAAVPGSWSTIEIGSLTGYATLDGERSLPGSIVPGASVFDAVVVTDGRGYEFTLDGAVDRSLFERMLASVTFGDARVTPIDHASETFTSPVYGYSIRVDPRWTVEPALIAAGQPGATEDAGSDLIHVVDTDTTIAVTADELGGQTFEQWMGDVHQEVLGDPDVPVDCKNGEPDTWPTQPVGDQDGRLMTLCNFAQVFVHVGDRAYTFTWENDTFSETSHMDVSYFKELLRSVVFTGS